MNQRIRGVGYKEFPYDLAVAYRVCPSLSKHAFSLPFADDKYLLSEVCLRSFRESLGNLRVKLWALLDGCPTEYEELFKKYFRAEDLVLVPVDSIGNQATFGRQIDILLAQEASDLVYFAEDDYFYLPGQFPKLVQFLRSSASADFVTAYDHPDCYTLDIHRFPKFLAVSGNHHWRTAASTCLTFLTCQETLRECESTFRTYCRGNSDFSLWQALTKHSLFDPIKLLRHVFTQPSLVKAIGESWFYGWRQILFGGRRQLWVALPGIATHLASGKLSPTIDWITGIQSEKDRMQSGESTTPTVVSPAQGQG